jgi:hypothetical protein
MTNYEKIKEMSLEDMAELLFDTFQHNASKGFLTITDAVEFLESEDTE